MKDFKSTREKYKPEKIKMLLIAEAPPEYESGRFFYYDDVKKQDSLFLEIMKALYKNEFADTNELRERKAEFLERFKADGYYLIDASPIPIKEKSAKLKQLERFLPTLVEAVNSLVKKETPIVLISSTVYEVCCDNLRDKGFNIINESPLPFPGSGQQKVFRDKFNKLIKIQTPSLI